jgi:hypothetical protein
MLQYIILRWKASLEQIRFSTLLESHAGAHIVVLCSVLGTVYVYVLRICSLFSK